VDVFVEFDRPGIDENVYSGLAITFLAAAVSTLETKCVFVNNY
jgi:hypothetical protein